MLRAPCEKTRCHLYLLPWRAVQEQEEEESGAGDEGCADNESRAVAGTAEWAGTALGTGLGN